MARSGIHIGRVRTESMREVECQGKARGMELAIARLGKWCSRQMSAVHQQPVLRHILFRLFALTIPEDIVLPT